MGAMVRCLSWKDEVRRTWTMCVHEPVIRCVKARVSSVFRSRLKTPLRQRAVRFIRDGYASEFAQSALTGSVYLPVHAGSEAVGSI